MPFNVAPEESKAIREEVIARLRKQFAEQYRTEIGDYRQEILDKLPSKKAELERAAKASAEEAEKIQMQMKEREAAELARKEQDRMAREREESKKAEIRKANAEANNLFDAALTAAPAYQQIGRAHV